MTADLLDAALAVQAEGHAPYSGFRVGAASGAGAGAIYVGCNVENASFPGTCAEAAAIAAMVAAGERAIAEVLTVADGDDLTTCCGCRQRIREFAAPGVLVHAAGPEGIRRTFTMDELLPASFGPENLSH